MPFLNRPRLGSGLLFLLGLALTSFAVFAAKPPAPLSYNRDIRPILSDNCFHCHGPDAGKRKGKLRLDQREAAIEKKAFIPGNPKESELVRRIFSADPDEQMPPPESPKKLTPAQRDLLRRWVAEGAKYEGHWAYQAPQQPATPATADSVDYLVQQRLKSIGLKPSKPADRRTLARRLYFDLVGIPPRPEEVEAFVKDRSPDAYGKLVEKLLASPQYGERMAMGWLDVVRFADTIGYHSDNPRNIWPYRDYVIKAFNENKRFDVFTREQLAGDLLPNAGQEQKVGTAFNRLLLSTEEGGAQSKDYEARMLTDRVRAIGSVWLGQTIGCAQCHDHKFDPIKARDFYAMGAFFADIQEPIIGGREPGMFVPTPEQAPELAKRSAEANRLQSAYDAPHLELTNAYALWLKAQTDVVTQEKLWTALKPGKATSTEGAKLEIKGDRSILVSGKKPEKDSYTLSFTNLSLQLAGLRIEALPDDSLPAKGPGRSANGNFVLTEVKGSIQRADGKTEPINFQTARASFEQTLFTEKNPYKLWNAASTIDQDAKGDSFGWAVLPEVGKPQQLVLGLATPLTLTTNDTLTLELQQNHGQGNHTLGRFRIAAGADTSAVNGQFAFPPAKEIADILALAADKRDRKQQDKLWEAYKQIAPELADLRKELTVAQKAKADFEGSVARCLVSTAAEAPRTVRILPRGNFLIETGDIVEPAIPGYLQASFHPAEKRRLNRLDLANWLVSRENPLTARVVMNRLWKQFFGTGLTKVLDDFGAQGEPPRNQALLDWLATEFMDSGWDMKHMVRLIVNSATYQQISKPSKPAQAADPFNRELASQSRWRLDAELVRDNALAISGLLVEQVGGPSVKPYQPLGYWENLNFPTREWEKSNGSDQYRRGLYTWWQRSYMHPSLLAFDAPTREECVAERNRSNIPQQALVLLNDPTYVEASRVFAARILKEGGATPTQRLRWAWHQALAREPRKDELQTTTDLLNKHLGQYRADPASADEVLKVGQAPIPDGVDKPELAAWTSVARVIFNLHETITRN